MSEMVKRVKRAVEAIGSDDVLDQMNPDYDKNLTAIARAAIKAMREPTDDIAHINGSANWPAMIDAALKSR